MKKARKGFTLVELVIVMGIMGLLGTMGMMAGQQATDAAKASNIADNLERVSSAMMSYYINNHETIDVKGAKIEDIVKGANGLSQKGFTRKRDYNRSRRYKRFLLSSYFYRRQ